MVVRASHRVSYPWPPGCFLMTNALFIQSLMFWWMASSRVLVVSYSFHFFTNGFNSVLWDVHSLGYTFFFSFSCFFLLNNQALLDTFQNFLPELLLLAPVHSWCSLSMFCNKYWGLPYDLKAHREFMICPPLLRSPPLIQQTKTCTVIHSKQAANSSSIICFTSYSHTVTKQFC